MEKAAKKKRASKKALEQQPSLRSAPNWALFGLALIGMGLTVYLTFSTWIGQALPGCTPGSGCDVVLSSRWAKLFGLPTSFWGFLTYAILGGIAFIKRADIYWKLAWVVSLFGTFYSIYLTAVSFIELKATCPYCITSAILMVTILGTVTYQWRRDIPSLDWRLWLLKTVSGGLILVIASHLHYAGIGGIPVTEEDPKVRALAEHLTKIKAKFYGAYWCPHCEEQKEMFGASAHRLAYIECSPQGSRSPQAAICRAAGIKTYPTWIIDAQRHEGVLSLNQLANISGFKGDS